MVDDELLPHQGGAALGVISGLPWASSLHTREFRAFHADFQEWTGRPANAFAGLGYDTGRLIVDAVTAVDGSMGKIDRLVDALSHARFQSPRGPLEMNPMTNSVSSPIYVRQVQQNGLTPHNEVTPA